jgi:CHAT domain-containing protein
MRRLIGPAIVLLVALFGAGCKTLPPEALAGGNTAGAEVTAVGANQVGEPCQFQAGTLDDSDVGAARSYSVRCGSWQQPSGRVFIAAAAPTSPAALATVAAQGLWRSYLNARLFCDEPRPTAILDGVEAVLMSCTRRNGGWPHLAIATSLGGRTFLVDGVPSALPALEATVASLSGRSVAAASQSPSAALQMLAASLSAQPFGSGDLDRYYGLMRLGDEQNAVENFAAAEDAFRDALAVQQRILGRNTPGIAMPLMHLALQISNQRRFVEADALFQRAGALIAQLPDPLVVARLDYYRAVHANTQGRHEDAKELAGRAEQEFAAFVPPELRETAARGATARASGEATRAAGFSTLLVNPDTQTAVLGLASVWRFEAILAYGDARDDDVRRMAQRARALIESSGLNPPGNLARATRISALSAARKGDEPAAVQQLSDSVRLFNAVTPNERPLAVTLFLSARQMQRAGDLDEALARFRAGAKIVRDRHLGLPEPIVTPFLTALFERAAKDPANAPALYAEMFEATQLIQGGLTAQYIAKAAARLASGDQKVSAALRQLQEAEFKLKELFLERDAEAQKPAAQQDAQRQAQLDAAITEAETQRNEAESAAQAAAPAYGQLVQAGASAHEVSELLRPGEAFLALQLGETASYGFLAKGGGIIAFRLGVDFAEAADLVRHLRETAQVGVTPRGDVIVPEFDLAAGHDLYRRLFAPVESELAGVARVIIATNGPLLSLPFEMLVTAATPAVGNGDYRGVPFLLKRFALSYVPAPQTFVGLRRVTASSAAPRPFIGFGDFRPASAAQLAASFPPERCSEDLVALSELGDLPGTRSEVQSIGGLLGAGSDEIILAEGFTKKKLLALDLKRYRIVHLATHGFLPTELRCKASPSVLLSLAPEAEDATDAFLDDDEILKLQMDADLVVLSACNTAGPGGSAGESLSGLARAFFFAGTRGLLVTHWAVDDDSAVLITKGTMQSTRSGETHHGTAEALRQAKLARLASAGTQGGPPILFSHPFAWAPFVLIGDGVRASGPTS